LNQQCLKDSAEKSIAQQYEIFKAFHSTETWWD